MCVYVCVCMRLTNLSHKSCSKERHRATALKAERLPVLPRGLV